MTDLEETFRTYDFKRQENLTQKFTNILATLKFFFYRLLHSVSNKQ